MNKLFKTVSQVSFGLAVIIAAASCNQNANTGSTSATDNSVAPITNQANEEKIAYIDYDTLAANYDQLKDARTKLEDKVKKAQGDLQTKGQAFQRELTEYQEKAATMSASERQATEERLARKQDELGRLEQNASASLAQDQSTELDNVNKTINEYLKKYAAEKGYDYILTYSMSNPTVLYANKKLDITAEVVEALNKEYKDKKAKEKK